MTSDVLFDADIPMHHQIYRQLRAEITDGMWIGRIDFPGEEEVALRYGVSVITSRQALVRLVADGLLKRERGRRPQAVFVPRIIEKSPPPSLFPTFPRHPYVYDILETDIRVAHAEACSVFGLDHGARLWHCSRLRRFQGRPHSFVLNVQTIEVGQTHKAADLAKLPMNQIFKKEGHKLGSITRRILAQRPSKLAAQHLGISVSSSLLVHMIVLSDTKNVALEWVQISLHPDEQPPTERFDLTTGLVKVSDIL